jgi:hypothetical protein
VDREESPVRLDPRLGDAAYADAKLAGIVRDRLDVARAAAEGSQERIEALGGRFAWLRMTRYEGPGELR